MDRYRQPNTIKGAGKDNTSGCTKEACAIRDEFPRFEGLDAVVLGVSKDSVESHKRFVEKHGLPFTLLNDAGAEVLEDLESLA